MNERKTALAALNNIFSDGKYSNLELAEKLKNHEPREKALVTNIVYGVIQNRIRIDYIINAYSKTPVRKMDESIKNILRMGVYQILYTDKIPLYAVVNESVALVRAKFQKGFVNAVLRSIARMDKKVVYPENALEYLSVYYSCPLWICKMWEEQFGFETAEKLIKEQVKKPPFTVRINTLKINVEDFIRQTGAKQSGIYDLCAELQTGMDISEDAGYRNGFYYPQDIASMIAAASLNPQKGETVVDVCAAPGGKTTHIAQLMENSGHIDAFDIYEHKIKLIEITLRRIGAKIVNAQVWDAAEVKKELVGKADRVLVDAPCSGLGILRRKPEIKYERTQADIKELINLQKRILASSAHYVKPGGVLVYSTCTVNKDENENITKEFLDTHKNFIPQDFEKPEKFAKETSVQLMPHILGSDGFYIAKFIRAI